MVINIINTYISTWTDAIYNINPYFWGSLGIRLDLGLSYLGAAWSIYDKLLNIHYSINFNLLFDIKNLKTINFNN